MSSKARLKSAKEALDAKEYDKAKNTVESILTFEPMNYNANVFHGLALLNLGDDTGAEKAYRRAIESNPSQVLAWRGLASFYEKKENWDRFTKTLFELLELFLDASDATKLAETIQRLLQHHKDHNNTDKVTEILHWYLPGSRYYDLLSTLPPPDHTQPLLTTTYESQCAIYDSLPILVQLKDIHQSHLSQWRASELEKRRTRLGAPKRDVIEKNLISESSMDSKIEPLYLEILNHPSTSDELRREIEAALFKFKYDHLIATSTKDTELKRQLIHQVMSMASGMVTINVPNLLAWTLMIEWCNIEHLNGYNAILFRRFQALFPEHALCGVINGLFAYLPSFRLEDDPTPIMPRDMALNAIIDGIESNSSSLFTHRVLSFVYETEKQYEDATAVSEAGLDLCKVYEKDSGLPYDLHSLAFERTLAIAFTYNYPPKHHMRAMGHIYSVLNQRPEDVDVLMAQGTCLEYSNKWDHAREVFEKVITIDSSNLTAKEEHSWCHVMQKEYADGKLGLEQVLGELSKRDDTDQVATQQARCYFKLGKCLWEQGGQERVNSYSLFIQSIKHVNKYAPSFTYLGLYYLQVAQPADVVRASKCFQKAFELDSRETEAARWLADGFADEKEWDLVEIVARRTIEGEGSTLEELVKGRYLSRNAWAWKAIGVVELNRDNYGAAVEAFQIALRANNRDVSSWVRLGESYAAAGRHAAALKTFNRSRELDSSDENWLALYAIADVLRLMGFHASAVETLKGIYDESNLAIVVSLSQSYVSQARHEAVSGFSGRAVNSYVEAIQHGLCLINREKYLRVAWKVLSDAFYGLAKLAATGVSQNLSQPVQSVLDIVQEEQLVQKSHCKELIDTGYISNSINTPETVNRACAMVAVLANEFAITLDFGRPDSVGSSWYDLAIALEELAKQTSLKSEEDVKKKIEKLSITAIRNALRSEPGNDDYWNTLGNLVFESDARLAQHSYIKAIELDGRNPTYWTNLGFLYIAQKDVELASYALKKSQTVDPDYVYAWVGLSIVASSEGRHEDAKMLYEHSFTISGGSELESNFGYAYHDMTHASKGTELHRQNYAMQRFTDDSPHDYAALHLHAIISEQLGQYDVAATQIDKCVQLLEAAYEDSESEQTEKNYALANLTLGRIRFALKHYDGAIEAFNTSLSLADDKKMKLTAMLGIGLASYYNNMDDSSIKGAFEEYRDVDAGVLLAQILWCKGEKDAATSVLLECVEIDSEHLGAISTLAAIGILTNDDGLLDAALSEILSMPVDKRTQIDEQRNVHKLLVQNSLISGDSLATIRMLTKQISFEPHSQDLRRDLSKLLLATKETDLGVNVALADDSNGSRLNADNVALQALAKADAGMVQEALSDAQRALYIDPTNQDNWKTLALIKLII